VNLAEGGKDAETVVAYMQVRIVCVCVCIYGGERGQERACVCLCVWYGALVREVEGIDLTTRVGGVRAGGGGGGGLHAT